MSGKGRSRLCFLRRLRSFNMCNRLLQMFHHSVVASVLFFVFLPDSTHPTPTPGSWKQICEDVVHRLQLSIQHNFNLTSSAWTLVTGTPQGCVLSVPSCTPCLRMYGHVPFQCNSILSLQAIPPFWVSSRHLSVSTTTMRPPTERRLPGPGN